MRPLNPLVIMTLSILTTSLFFSETLSAKVGNRRARKGLISSQDNLYYYNQRNVVNGYYRGTNKYNYYGPTYYRYQQIREQERRSPPLTFSPETPQETPNSAYEF